MRSADLPRRNRRMTPVSPWPYGSLPRPASRAERLVRRRAGYRCEGCSSTGTTECVQVVRFSAPGVPVEVMSGPANLVLLCETCSDRVHRRDPVMGVRGFWADHADPRLVVMAVRAGDSLAAFWRSEDGCYLSEPPEGAV